jgi:hypothetical protein
MYWIEVEPFPNRSLLSFLSHWPRTNLSPTILPPFLVGVYIMAGAELEHN